MLCPNCNNNNDTVIDSRASGRGQRIRRRRECGTCGHRFTTMELNRDDLSDLQPKEMTSARKIYLASSWRNPLQPVAVAMLREAGHEVYDFRNPSPGNTGFSWSDIDPVWLQWTPEMFVSHLTAHPIAAGGFSFDKSGLDWCDACVLLLPCGRSAHLEAGYAIGQGKPTLIVLSEDRFEPELMYLLADAVVPNIDQMVAAFQDLGKSHQQSPR